MAQGKALCTRGTYSVVTRGEKEGQDAATRFYEGFPSSLRRPCASDVSRGDCEQEQESG